MGKRILVQDYSDPLQRMGVVAWQHGVGTSRPPLLEVFSYYLSRARRGFPLTDEERKIRREYGNK